MYHQVKGRFPVSRLHGSTIFLQIPRPCVPLAARQVQGVALTRVRLTLERDVPVCLIEVPVLHEPHQPLHEVPQVKGHVEHLPHLRGVYRLVVNHTRGYHRVAADEQHAEQVDCGKPLEGDDIVPYYLHKLNLFLSVL